jgi:hypothetical protein
MVGLEVYFGMRRMAGCDGREEKRSYVIGESVCDSGVFRKNDIYRKDKMSD